MATQDEINLSISIRTEKLVAELRKIPGISEATAKSMARAYNKEYASIEKDAARAADRAKVAAEKTRDAWKSSAERTASLMGGTFGDISDSVFDLGERLGGLANGMGGVQGAAVALGAGLTATAFALTFAAKSTLEWMDTIPVVLASLKEWEGLEPVGAADIAALKAYADATSDVAGAAARAKVAIAADLAPAMTDLRLAMLGASEVARNLASSLAETDSLAGQFAKTSIENNVQVRILANTWEYFTGVGREAADQISKVDTELEALDNTVRQTDDDARAMAAALGLLVDDISKGPKLAAWDEGIDIVSLEASLEEAHAARKAMWSADTQAAAEGAAAAATAAEAEWMAMLDRVQGSASAVSEQVAADVGDKIAEIQQQQVDAVLMATEELIASSMAAWSGFTALKIESIGQEITARKKAHAAVLTEIDAEKQKIKEMRATGEISAEQYAQQIAQIEGEEEAVRAANQAKRAQQKEQIDSAFKLQQGLARTGAIMNAAAATLALTLALAPLGFGAPVAAIGITAPMLALELATINQQKPPKFAVGGMVRDRASADHVMVSATPNEAVLTERGVAAVGGAQGVAAANMGQAPSGGGGLTAVYLDGALMGAAVAQQIARDPGITREIARRTGVIPGRRTNAGRR